MSNIKAKMFNKAPAIGSLLLGGLGAGWGYKESKGDDVGDRAIATLSTGAIGALAGFRLGRIAKSVGGFNKFKARGGPSYTRSTPKHPEAKDLGDKLYKVKTKADAKSLYRKYSIKTHPDKTGGSSDAFKDVNNEWNEFMMSRKFDKLAFLRSIYKDSLMSELEKVSASNNITDMSEAFYQANKRLEKERKSAGRKKMLIGTGTVGITGAGLYGAYKAGIGKKLTKKVQTKIHSTAEKVGREAGVVAGKATNEAVASYSKTLKQGAKNVASKFRGGDFATKVIKKVLFKK